MVEREGRGRAGRWWRGRGGGEQVAGAGGGGGGGMGGKGGGGGGGSRLCAQWLYCGVHRANVLC